MSGLSRHAGVLAAYAVVHLRRHAAFKASLFFEQGSYFVQFVISILLWRYLFTRLPRFEGWSFDAILVLQLFGNLFVTFFHSFFLGCHTFHGPILTGGLDLLLIRPIDARFAQMAIALQPTEFINRLISQLPLVLYIWHRGVELEPLRVAAGLAAMLMGLVAFSLIQLTLSYSAFWIGRGDAILSFLDLFYGFYRFPLNALPFAAQLALTIFAPLLLAVTYPALFATGGATGREMALSLAASLALTVVWFVIEERVYARGLAAYQSAGG